MKYRYIHTRDDNRKKKKKKRKIFDVAGMGGWEFLGRVRVGRGGWS